VHDLWSQDEERRLALCMKIYKDEISVIGMAAPHFPDRASVSIFNKWNKSLDPSYDNSAYTPDDDKKLFAAVRKLGPGNWTVIATKKFPNRRPESLKSRWCYLASEAKIVKKYEDVLIGEYGARKGVVGKNGLLSTDDFVIRAKRQKKVTAKKSTTKTSKVGSSASTKKTRQSKRPHEK